MLVRLNAPTKRRPRGEHRAVRAAPRPRVIGRRRRDAGHPAERWASRCRRPSRIPKCWPTPARLPRSRAGLIKPPNLSNPPDQRPHHEPQRQREHLEGLAAALPFLDQHAPLRHVPACRLLARHRWLPHCWRARNGASTTAVSACRSSARRSQRGAHGPPVPAASGSRT